MDLDENIGDQLISDGIKEGCRRNGSPRLIGFVICKGNYTHIIQYTSDGTRKDWKINSHIHKPTEERIELKYSSNYFG